MFTIKSVNTRTETGAASKTRVRRFILFILLLSGSVTALDTAVCPAQSPVPEPIQLKRIRSIRGKGYTAFIFKFDKKIPPQQPEIQGNEITIRFDGVATELEPRREYRALDSWIAMEPGEGYLTARIGLPHNFSKMDYYRDKNRNKWIIRLYTDKKKTEPEEKQHVLIPAPGYDPEKQEPVKEMAPVKPPDPTASLAPKQEPEKAAVDKKVATQDVIKSNGLLTLNFYQSDIQEILSALAMEREINIATAQNVSGKVSVHLYQVTLEAALNAIALAGGFTYRKQNDLYYIYKPKESRDPESDGQQMKVFKLRYADTVKVQEILSTMPNMGYVQTHQPSKTLIVHDTAANLDKIEGMIGHWDKPPKQVLIEAKILQVRLTDGMEFGVNWSKILGDLNVSTSGFSKARLPTDEAVNPVPSGDNITGLFSNMITAIGSNYQFAMALDALQTKTKINTLSTPKVLAIHGKTAKVQVGGQQGYRVTTTNLGIATETIEFIDTGTILEITPFIDDDGNILMNVMPSIASAELDKTGIPVVRSTQVTTWLMAKSGETVFIGGLIEDIKLKKKEGLPCLGNLDAIGTLFSRTTSGLDKIELVILITPQLIGDNIQVVGKESKERVRMVEKEFSKYPLSPKEEMRDFVKPIK
jgi:protein transport protein HofQ